MKQESDSREAHPFRAHFPIRFLSRIAGGPVLVLGTLITALAVSVGLALSVGAGEVRAQEAVTLHETTITVAAGPGIRRRLRLRQLRRTALRTRKC